MQTTNKFKDIDSYIKSFPENDQILLNRVRETIAKVVPQATESINYMIPTFKFHGNLIHFAGYKSHIGLYPGSVGVSKFKDELKGYKTSKGTIQIPKDKPLPLDLIKRITKYCVEARLEKLSKKK